MSEIVFEARNIHRAYGRGRRRTVAGDGVDLTLETGTVTLLSGPSGSGKTTVLHILGGGSDQTAGRCGGVERPSIQRRWGGLRSPSSRSALVYSPN
jgi:ABC-type lipoprotein export system ATPase subunit